MNTEFFRPTDIRAAVALLEQYQQGAVIVNGGSDIVEKIAAGHVKPAAIIYIADIAELKGIEQRDGKIVLGGAVTYHEMLQSPVIQRLPGMMEAVRNLGSPAIRQVATAAGNLGTGAPSADCTTMLMGLSARIVVVSARGERTIPIEEFFVKTYKTVLAPDELIREIYFDAPQKGDSSGYIRLARRKSQDIGKVLISASLSVRDGVCTKAVIGFGALNATAVRGRSIEEAIVGKKKEEALSAIRAHFPKEAGLRQSRFKHYKELVTCTAIERAVAMAWNNAEGVQ